MKVVINRCFGGFSLSHEAVMHYANLAGIKLYTMVNKEVVTDLDGVSPYSIYYKTEDGQPFESSALERHDPFLVKTVEELGIRADGPAADLWVQDVGDFDYSIDNYDGQETIYVRNL